MRKPKPKAEADNTNRGLNNSSYPTRTEFNNCFITYLYLRTISLKKSFVFPLKSQEANMFLNNFRTIFVAETMFPGLPACFQLFPARETLLSRLGALKQCFKTIVQT